MSPADFERLRSMPRDQLEQLLTRALPLTVQIARSSMDDGCAEGCPFEGSLAWDAEGRQYRGIRIDWPVGRLVYVLTALPLSDYGPPGDTVWGSFGATYTASLGDSTLRIEGPARFAQGERSGSWFAEHIDTIGPLAVRLFSMAAGAGWLPMPFEAPIEVASGFADFAGAGGANPFPDAALTATAAPGGAPVFELFTDAADPVIEGMTATQTELLSSVGDYGWHPEWIADDLVMSEGVADSSMLFPGEPVPPTAFDQLIPGGDSWSLIDPMESGSTFPGIDSTPFPETPTGSWGMDPTSAPAAPPTAPAPVFTAPDISLGSVLDQLERGMGQSLRLLATANQVRAVFNQPTSVQPGGVTRTVMPDGRIAQRDPAGRVTYTRGAPGVGERATNGDMIVNKGDGTFLRVKPDGRMTTERYTAAGAPAGAGAGLGSMLTSSGGVPPVLLLGAVGLGAYLLMRRR